MRAQPLLADGCRLGHLRGCRHRGKCGDDGGDKNGKQRCISIAVVFRRNFVISRRAFLASAAGATVAARISAQSRTDDLYNGIALPRPWPPRRYGLSREPQRPPYLASPPQVINIDVGRQLFVDDFLIEESALHREFHSAVYHAGNPVLSPSQPWEIDDPYAAMTNTAPSSAAMVFSDGVFFDPADQQFKMWYMAGYQQHTALATSQDGITWRRRPSSVIAGTNIVRKHRRDSSTVWLDLNDSDASARFKMAWTSMEGSPNLRLSTSPDGVRWTDRGDAGIAGDRSTCFYNPFRRRWCFSLRADDPHLKRIRRYYESPSFIDAKWAAHEPVPWVAADSLDRTREGGDVPAELYNLDVVAYESLMIGMFAIFRGESSDREKPNDLCVGFSRDGFHWARPSRQSFIGVSERQGDWNWANVQSAGGVCLVVGDQLYFYVSGRAGVPGTSLPGRCSTGLATLRRDGFASVTDVWPAALPRPIPRYPSTLITRPVRFSGAHCFVNADVAGSLRIELLDQRGEVIPGFTAGQCEPISGNRTKHAVRWRNGQSIATLADTVVRFKFVLDRARLFAFWVSPVSSGASRGYLGAGGPGYSGNIDA